MYNVSTIVSVTPIKLKQSVSQKLLNCHLQELKKKRQHRVAGPNDAVKNNNETKTKTKSVPGNALEERRGSAEDRAAGKSKSKSKVRVAGSL